MISQKRSLNEIAIAKEEIGFFDEEGGNLMKNISKLKIKNFQSHVDAVNFPLILLPSLVLLIVINSNSSFIRLCS